MYLTTYIDLLNSSLTHLENQIPPELHEELRIQKDDLTATLKKQKDELITLVQQLDAAENQMDQDFSSVRRTKKKSTKESVESYARSQNGSNRMDKVEALRTRLDEHIALLKSTLSNRSHEFMAKLNGFSKRTSSPPDNFEPMVADLSQYLSSWGTNVMEKIES